MDDSEKKITILCLGPKGSGKTTLLKKLQDAEGIDNTYSPVPTIGTNIYDINYLNKHGKKQTVQVREVGGEMAPLWSNYLDGVEKVSNILNHSFTFICFFKHAFNMVFFSGDIRSGHVQSVPDFSSCSNALHSVGRTKTKICQSRC